jgi:hypothetical protein
MRTGSKVHDCLPASSNATLVNVASVAGNNSNKHLPPSSTNSSNELKTLATFTTSSFAPVLQKPSCATGELLVLPKIASSLTSSPLVDYFGVAILANAQDCNSPFELGALYPQFSDCFSMHDVIRLSSEIAPCSFDIVKARAAHHRNPKVLDSTILDADLHHAMHHGLYSLLTTRFTSAERITLQPAIVTSDFQSVITFDNLLRVAVHGVSTETHSSFIPNFGIDCPIYPDDIADPAILIDHLHKLHSSGQFIILPLDIVQRLAASEGLTIHVSPLFITKKADKDIGRLVFNFSFCGPNHPDNRSLLAEKYGSISPPQLGDICRLIENAHAIFPQCSSSLEAIRRDIQGAFHHLRYSVPSSLLCMGQVIINDRLYGVISSVAVMGDQTVNYAFNQVSVAIDDKLRRYISSLTTSPLSLSAVATDDIIAIGPPPLIDAIHNKIGLIVGDGRQPGLCSALSSIEPDKDLRGQQIVILGWLFDVPNRMVWPNHLTFAKLVYCMFTLPGLHPTPGQAISVGNLMLMGAHAMRSSNILLALLSFSRGFLANIRGSSNPRDKVFLTRRSCHDIQMWRLFLTMAFHDPRVLHCSTATPLLRMRLNSDDSIESRDLRSIRAATLLAYSDACTGEGDDSPGIGGYIPGYGWFGGRYQSLLCLLHKSSLVRTPINVLELIALIITASLTIQTYTTLHGSARGHHFHIFCDNIASVAKARTHRSNHPIYSYLLYILSYIQLHHGCTVGSSYIAGTRNIVADAASRCFSVPNGRFIYQRYLQSLPMFQPSKTCISDINLTLLSFNSAESKPLLPRPIKLELITSRHFLSSRALQC